MAVHFGFTGTRKGMSEWQKQQLYDYLLGLSKPGDWFHHGDCKGADEQAHGVACKLDLLVVTHPCGLSGLRAYCVGATRQEPVKPPLQRNHDIVNAVGLLIAAPATDQEELRSGTWATIRYAKKRKVRVLLCERECDEQS